MMVTYDLCNLRIVFDLREDAFTNSGVLLHLAPLLQAESPRFFEQAGRQADLANVVDQSAQMRKLLLLLGQAQAVSDISSVDRDSCGVTSCVSIPGIQR